MKSYLAPLEGITGYIFRSAYHHHFAPADKYFIPFLTPTYTHKFGNKEQNEVLPEHNEGRYTVPQILTNKADDFIWAAKWLQEFGYEEVNLNLGCPSRTVVTKKRGAGFLGDTDELERFFEKVFDETDLKISVKTRLGLYEEEEFSDILAVYNRYPLEEIILHPRVQTDYYKGRIHYDAFGRAFADSRAPMCYNGDIFCRKDLEKITERFPQTNTVMLGRGVLQNPGLIGELRTGEKTDMKAVRAFHDELLERYREYMSGDKNVLYKMKELWFYLGELFEDDEKNRKKIRKAEKMCAYMDAIDEIFMI